MKPVRPDTRIMGHQVIRLSETISTNNYASELLKTDKWSEGTAIIADYQFGGRGQRGAVWQSAKGQNLLTSIILTPAAHGISGIFNLNKAVAVALRDAMAGFISTEVWIKWPNDILTSEGKLAGILIENQMNGDAIERSIVGIGVNVNQVEFNQMRAVSLKLLKGYSFSVDEVFYQLCKHLEETYESLKQGKLQEIESRYHSHLFGMGRFCTFSDNVEEFTAEVLGTDEYGRLKLRDTDGNLRVYDVKTLIWEFDD